MRSMLPASFLKWITQRNFKYSDIASHSIRAGGHFAGRIDDFTNGRIRGWIYDARRPNEPVMMRLLINGSSACEFTANIYREDIANIVNNNGLNGIDIDIGRLVSAESAPVTIKIEIVSDRRYCLGPVVAIFESNSAARPSRRSAYRASGSIEDRIEHLFDHVTDTHEDTCRRLTHLQDSVGSRQIGLGTGLAFGANGGSSLAALAKTTISGIGAFQVGELDEAIEQDVMTHRIESHILKAKLAE